MLRHGRATDSIPGDHCVRSCEGFGHGAGPLHRWVAVQPLVGEVEGGQLQRHASSQAKHQVNGGLLLDAVVGQGAVVLQLLAGKDKAVVLAWDALLLLDLGLQVVDGVRVLNVQCDGLPVECLHEELHAATK